VHTEVARSWKRRAWRVKPTLAALGVVRNSYYRWLKEEARAKDQLAEPAKPVPPYEALSEEKQALRAVRKAPDTSPP
jgi:hypothetical protein